MLRQKVNVALCRFMYTRLLLFRPVVYLSTKYPSLFLSQYSVSGNDTMDDRLVKLVCESCVQSATELISAIHRNLEHSHRSSAWHAIYCESFQPRSVANQVRLTRAIVTFGAAVLLLCTQICPAVGREVLQRDFDKSWDRAQAILDYYRVQRPVARQSIQTLKALRGKSSLRMPVNATRLIASRFHATTKLGARSGVSS